MTPGPGQNTNLNTVSLACHIFNELSQTFAFWGPNSQLHLVPFLYQNSGAARPGMAPIAQMCDGTVALGKCWKVFEAVLTWQDAENACVAWGGHLASISSPLEQAVAMSLATTFSNWIGLHDPQYNSNFVWKDGSAGTGYTNWCPGEPNNAFRELGGDMCPTGGDSGHTGNMRELLARRLLD